MMDLFESGEGELLPVKDAELILWRHAELGDEQELLQHIIRHTPWRLEHVTVWGKSYPQPRLVAFYGDNGKSYSYSDVDLTPLPWTPALLLLKDRVEALCRNTFNSVLLNYYRDHRDSMGFHADDEPELGPSPVIASVTLGASRLFVMKHKYRESEKDVKLQLPSGSLLLMKGATQGNWKHGIPRVSKPCGPRINLTFRNILP